MKKGAKKEFVVREERGEGGEGDKDEVFLKEGC